MVAGATFDPAALAAEHFGAARLHDARRTRRLVRTAELFMRHPGGTLPEKVGGDRADLAGVYRLAACPRVTHAAVLEPHRRVTLGRMRDHAAAGGVVLVVHDTTEPDFTTPAALRGGRMGQIGKGLGRGYLCHNALAVTAEAGAVLGLAGQVLHARRDVPAGETRRQKRADPRRESRLWARGCEAVGPAPAPPAGGGGMWVDVCDRGADAVEFIEYAVTAGRRFVVRVSRDRVLDGADHDHVGRSGDRVHRKLVAYARDLPALGGRSVAVPAVPGRSAARVARVSVSAGVLALRATRFAGGACAGAPLAPLWVVRVAEVDPPPGADPLEWVLLTNVPAGTFAAASERVDWYERRPVVEDYHKGQKTGCGVEAPRLRADDRVGPMVALASVVAAVLLGLRQAARGPAADRAPAADAVPPAYVRVLSGVLTARARRPGRGPARDDVSERMSVRTFLYGVAKLGGHLGRTSDGPPGWLTLWRGWARIQDMVEGVRAISGERCV